MTELDIQIKRLNDIADKIGESAKQIEDNASFTLADRIEMVRTQICEHYCKYPVVYGDDEGRLMLECDRCPMRWLG